MATRRINSGSARPRILEPTRPNVGLEVRYTHALDTLIEQMHRSLMRFLVAQYRATPPAMAQDTPTSDIRRAMVLLRRRWMSRFDEAAKRLGRWHAVAMAKRSDAQLRNILSRAGIAVEFTMTPAMKDVMDATATQQVGLIRSIAEEHLGHVEGMVMRSVQQGGDVGGLTRGLRREYGLSKDRASLIARHQNSMATAAMTRARQQELGIGRAVWLHSHAGKEPRPTHLANDGKEYDVALGWFDPDPRVRARIWPGQLINCRCVSRPIVPGI